MIKQLLKISVIFIGFLVILGGCEEKSVEKKPIGKYSIGLGEFKTVEGAKDFKSELEPELKRKSEVIESEQNLFLLKYGNYFSSFEAGREAFDLIDKKLIKNYNILFEENIVSDLYANVLFIARYQGRPSVYIYNIPSKQSKLFWSRWGRKVIAINHSNDRNSVFITTALGYGQQGSFPYVKDVRVYLFTGKDNLINEVAELGDGFQIYTYWDNRDTFKVNLTHPDSVNTVEMIQRIVPFDLDGNKGKITERIFKLTEYGFPVPPNSPLDFLSPQGNFQLREVNDQKESYLYIRDIANKGEVLLTEFNGKIKNIKWSTDDKFVFAIIDNASVKPENDWISEVLIIGTKEKKIVRSFKGPLYENLLVQGNLLFFDQQYERISQITIYDCVTGNIYDEIQIPGGCGINNLY